MPDPLTVVQSTIRSCTSCWLSTADHTTLPVPYRGPVPAPVLVIGEAPGDVEDRASEPFVGRAGKALADQLRQARVDPDRFVGFCNIVSCFPGRKRKQFRTPALAEQAACRPNLEMQIALARPQVVILAGATALNAFRPDLQVSKDRGRPLVIPGLGDVVIPTFHPSATLRAKHLAPALLRDLLQVRWRWRVSRQGRWPEDCRLCHDEVERYDRHGVAWCLRHWPGDDALEGPEVAPLQMELA